jgi:DNA polymerase-3 subunit delta'
MLEAILDAHPHARAVLRAALPPGNGASHAYLFHGPAGSGKRAAARELAVALLTESSPDVAGAAERVRSGAHPDLTWITPSGADAMIVADVDEAVVSAATRTPFESTRRVFVLEQADSMNDQVANRMLKTLEEPPSYVHLILLSDRPGNVIPTIVSRCQPVRFEAPSAESLARRLETANGIDPQTARACARLSLGDAELALELSLGDGQELRVAAERYARAAISGRMADAPWEPLLDRARERAGLAGDEWTRRIAAEAEALPDRERKRHQREGETAAKRAGRRAHAGTLDRGLALVSLWLRDVACAADGASDLIRHSDRVAEVVADAGAAPAARLRDAVLMVEEARTALHLNPSEDLLLAGLASRLGRVLNG